jgi:hypothetical protein
LDGGNVAPTDTIFADYMKELSSHIESREEIEDLKDQMKVLKDQREVAFTAKEVMSMRITKLVTCLEDAASELQKQFTSVVDIFRGEISITAAVVGGKRPSPPIEVGSVPLKRPRRIVHLAPGASRHFCGTSGLLLGITMSCETCQ